MSHIMTAQEELTVKPLGKGGIVVWLGLPESII